LGCVPEVTAVYHLAAPVLKAEAVEVQYRFVADSLTAAEAETTWKVSEAVPRIWERLLY